MGTAQGGHLLFLTDSGDCTLWGKSSLGWFCGFLSTAVVSKDVGSIGWGVCVCVGMHWQGFGAIRCRFMGFSLLEPTRFPVPVS